MIHQALLKKAVAGRDPVLVEFIDKLAPAILIHFVTIPALGGSGQSVPEDPCIPVDAERVPLEKLERFSLKDDQSMVTHILNGIFAGMRLAEKLPPAKALNETERRLWLLGFVAHDYTKVYGIQINAGNIPVIRQIIACLGQRMNFADFWSEWETYLDDVVFLAQNTQTVEGANLDVMSFTHLQTHPRRLEVLRLLSSIADILVHVTNPCEVVRMGSDGRNRAANLHDKMNILFGAGQAPRFTFHQLTEVRGLISNLINNAVMRALKAQSCEEFLFFPNGIVYLAPPQYSLPNADAITEDIWSHIKTIIGDSEGFGVRRGGTGFVASSALYEIVGFGGVLKIARRKAMRLSGGYATSRLYGFLTGQSDNDLLKQLGNDKDLVKEKQIALIQEQQLPDDIRVDRLAEFLTFVQRAVRDSYKGKADVTPLLLATIKLNDVVSNEEAMRNKGGTAFGWFYVGACYVKQNPGADEIALEELMDEIVERVLEWVEAQDLKTKSASAIEDDVKDYLQSTLEIDGLSQSQKQRLRFTEELSSYLKNKGEKRPFCSLCSTPYQGVGQEATEIPFINQQYSNKNPLYTSAILRGVCPVCRIEMILRRVQQPGAEQGNKSVHLYFYPTYFFTPETAAVIKSYLNNELQDLNVFDFLRYMRQNGFTSQSLVDYEGFASREDGHRYTISSPHYSEHDAAGLFFCALRPLGKKPTDTDAWIMPVLYGLALPLLLNVKVVTTASFVPLFSTGTEFRETAVLDAPHSFVRHVLGHDRFRVNETDHYLMRLLRLYDLHLDVFAEPKDMHWPQINAVVKDVVTDPLYVFAYYDRKRRDTSSDKNGKKKEKESNREGIPPWDIERYFDIYYTLGGEPDMGMISETVNAYATFYRAKYKNLDSAYAVLKPFAEAADVIIDSDPKTESDDLRLLVAGAMGDLMKRIWSNNADGWDPIVMVKGATTSREARKAASRDKQLAFADLFIERVFNQYCNGDRATLRERLNRLRSAARFYYLQNYGRQAEPELEAVENE
ncbi:MAG: type I-D CRISPR-associated protein Cas10d/Csc3 [Anaerolineae bacterium]|nr:type I-D CRISPR-associated protein Cas10d/Csc3 [Anaerolineae bacterium]